VKIDNKEVLDEMQIIMRETERKMNEFNPNGV
jgi:hypothetical protein